MITSLSNAKIKNVVNLVQKSKVRNEQDSFVVEGVHHEDLALILDKLGLAVRSGQMCAEPLMNRMRVTGMLRASFAPYNTQEEAEYFVKCLKRAVGMLI